MERQQMNMELVQALQEWDPIGWGRDAYETEIADCVMAVSDLDDPKELAVKIQGIYELSFEIEIHLKECRAISEKLLLIKHNASCSL
ncbi:DUF1871 family protein [Bacillus sp. CECT 9360]|uniref:DUF1871 family protein n=1 Tax=Bacillus sp. CECT 9360 TaxID=2845821 RepID=UPI001E332577|nr:DUF1871 family protein [Bacillus sp. CECT 9360]CAH0344601.1 hypothetical protein BCI9360_00861 [Bacillus sp. CECT 9360]